MPMLTEMPRETRLLAVDDNSDSAELVARIGSRSGYEVMATSDPTEVRTLIRCWRPEVLTIDLCMPELDAIELFSILKESRFDGRLLIISGQGDWLRKQASKLAAAHGIRVVGDMQKPIDVPQLRQLLASMLPAASLTPSS